MFTRCGDVTALASDVNHELFGGGRYNRVHTACGLRGQLRILGQENCQSLPPSQMAVTQCSPFQYRDN